MKKQIVFVLIGLVAGTVFADRGLAVQSSETKADSLAVHLVPKNISLPEKAVKGVDLGIGDDRIYGRPVSWSKVEPLKREGMLATVVESRPGVFIAWRNTNLIEEVEVRVRNLGTEEGRGEVFVDILDEEGKVLIHLEPPADRKIVTIPPRERGGAEGKIVKMKADRRLNRLIDLYDRARIRYDVRASVQAVDVKDANPADNVKVKAYNIPFRAKPGHRHTLAYSFANFSKEVRAVRWHLEATRIPEGWNLTGRELRDGTLKLATAERIKGFLTFDVPENAKEGDLVELRLSLLDAGNREVIGQHEWFLVYDTQPPHVSNVKITPQKTGKIRIDLMASDPGSGVLEASGVWVEYSTDKGHTFSQKTAAYQAGNFVDPTTFLAEIGPFRPGTSITTFLYASDTAGNIQKFGPETLTIK